MMLGMPASSSIAMPIGRRSHMRAQLGEEHRDQQADRHRDQHRDQRRDQRAVDRRERAELLGDRIPALLPEESRTRTPAAPAANRSISENDARRRGGSGRRSPPRVVRKRKAISPSRRRWSALARDDASGITHRAGLQRNINHGSSPGRSASPTPCLPIRSGADSSGRAAATQAMFSITAEQGEGAVAAPFPLCVDQCDA